MQIEESATSTTNRDVEVAQVTSTAFDALPVIVPIALTLETERVFQVLASLLFFTILRDVMDAVSDRRPVRWN